MTCPAQYPLVPATSIWRYLDDGSDQGIAWRGLQFDDSEWPEGRAMLGYGEGPAFTLVSFGTNAGAKHITTYFRQEFQVADPQAYTNLQLRLLRDDGVVVYLNGQEILRSNLPEGVLNSKTLATASIGDLSEDLASRNILSPSLLLPGRNLVAAEIHQSSGSSSDIRFELELLGINANHPPTVSILAPAANALLHKAEPTLIQTKITDQDGHVVRVEFFDGNEKLGESLEPPFSLVWSNTFPGSHTLSAVATDDGGLKVRSTDVPVLVNATEASGYALVPVGSEWRFWDNGTDPGPSWKVADFDDQNWRSGHAQFGYGDGDEITTLKFGSDPNNKYITTYFRQTFQVTLLEGITDLQLRLLRDDGAIVYLNGQEVLRSNMPQDPITPMTFAVLPVGDIEELGFFTARLDPHWLLPGSNIIAVELHQSDPATSDASFDLELLTVQSPTLVRGPWLQNGTPNSVVIRWRTDVPSEGLVRIGPAPNQLNRLAVSPNFGTEHEVWVPSLLPGTLYYYSVGTSQRQIAGGPDFFFKTPPPRGSTAPIRIWAIGDSGTANRDAQDVRNAYLRFAAGRYTDVWLMLGDNAYDSGTDAEYQAAVFDTYRALLPQSILWSVVGNHDTDQESVVAPGTPYFQIFTLPRSGEAGGTASGTEQYYAFDYGQVHFVCLDSMTSGRNPGDAMLRWLESDLATTDQPWIIALWHHPAYSKGSHDTDTSPIEIAMRQNVLPILEAHGVDLVLCGHSHSYERSLFLHGHYGFSSTLTPEMIVQPGGGQAWESGAYTKQPSPNNPAPGAVYVVAGSSGQISGGELRHPAMFVALNRLGSLVLDVEGPRLDVRFLRETGEIDDGFTLLKGPTLSITDAQTLENGANGSAQFEIRLSEPLPVPIDLELVTVPGSAMPGVDYLEIAETITLAPGATHHLFAVYPLDDDLIESNEVFRVRLSATGPAPVARSEAIGIIEDDEPRPVLQAISPQQMEGNSGQSPLQFQLRLSAPSEQTVKVRFATTTNGSATVGSDFNPTNGTVIFLPGITESSVMFAALGDAHPEPDETVPLALTQIRNAQSLQAPLVAMATLLNDDGMPPSLRLDDLEVVEGNSTIKFVSMPLLLSYPSPLPVSVVVASRDGTAFSLLDYQPRSNIVSIVAGRTNATVRFSLIGDIVPEPVKHFYLDLVQPINATLERETVRVTVLNDDAGPPRIQSITVEDSEVEVVWTTVPGRTYRVQFADQIPTETWHDLPGDILADAPQESKTDLPDSESQRFYRVMLLP